MSIHFHPLRIKAIKKETEQCVTVELDVPAELNEAFQYKQGQSLTMRAFIDGEEIRRTYSLCSSPLENQWKVAIKKLKGGIFSGFVTEKLKPGDSLEVMEPVGKFYTELHPDNKEHYLAFAAGSGITPVISIIKTTLITEPKSSFTLVYGNRTRASIIFFEELEGLKNKFIDRFHFINILSRERTDSPLNFGRIDKDKLQELEKLIDFRNQDEIFVCGPEEMIFCVRDYLLEKEVNEKKIHFELFTTTGKKKSAISSRYVSGQKSAIETGPLSKITVKLDGRSFDFNLVLNSETTILDAALNQGADLPFACKGGMCCTCKARLLEGKVEMDVHWGLEHDEVEKGYILTCQSHPKTEKVVVDFDIK
jgi:ring-1,2-phenylacetyl-CoA epoxidase subunit PaaE